MKLIITTLLLLHGLIHLIGFIKAFGISDVKQLSQPISKTFGILWLMVSIFFIATFTLYAFTEIVWWPISFAAIILSQFLIFRFWKDSKFGTIINIVILTFTIAGYGSWNFKRSFTNEVHENLQQKEYFANNNLSEEDIAHLPEIIKKYIRLSGCIGKPKVNNFKIEFNGKIRKDEGSEWMPFSSIQYNFMNVPARLFFMHAEMKKMPVTGYHRYENANASMDIRLFSLFRVQFQKGQEMDTAETVTFFNDMCCQAPATLIDKRITWKEKENNIINATYIVNGISISADLYFDDKGNLINFKSNDRFASFAGKKLPWSTPLKNYKEINGYRLPTYAETINSNEGKDFCYGTFETTSVKYNCSVSDY